jgi:hypothetical protein
MDFIIKLLKSRDSTNSREYNSIFIITDRLIKEVKFVSFNKAIDISRTAHIVIREVVAIESLLDK